MKNIQLLREDGGTHHSVLDFAYLERQTLGDAGLEAELLLAFQVQADGVLRQLREAASMTACEKADLAHLLKGSARAIGAIRVGLASEIYEAHAADQGSAGDAALCELAAAIAEASEVIGRSLAKPSIEEAPARPARSGACRS